MDQVFQCPQGKVVVGVGRDITENKRAEEELTKWGNIFEITNDNQFIPTALIGYIINIDFKVYSMIFHMQSVLNVLNRDKSR